MKQNQSNQDLAGVNQLLTEVSERNHLKNDAALCHFLRVAPPVISKMRHGHLPIGDSMILKMHELGGMDVFYIRRLLAGQAD